MIPQPQPQPQSPPQQLRPTSYIVPSHLEEYNIPLSAWAAARPQFHNIVASALIFSTAAPEEDDVSLAVAVEAAVPGRLTPRNVSPSASTSTFTTTTTSPTTPPSTTTPINPGEPPQTPPSTTSTPSTTNNSPTSTPATTPSSTPTSEETETPLQTLLLQRTATDSHPLHWETPGGLLDPTLDATVLAGIARQVREETGFHVSRFVDLVAVDEWTKMKRGMLLQEMKLTFAVEVREAAVEGWEEMVRVRGNVYRGFAWVREGEVRRFVSGGKKSKRGAGGGSGRLGTGFVGGSGRDVVMGFEALRGLC
ncbi:NUDIX hydrolase [Aspergillus saccharolyticus JOP 1030-1]|uniref:Nudix hydrolase domain-containing protein n=1 Tax=Aspergillus saccharolyticus JOP 1030-1 TaxID=1450539 RepID=A0A318ZQ52_9EURO|nr:hypothetical protein BP01DRAFT_419863 [Aspergillus saccharolyticus JOP 1030-1]PYH49729.1 hypothetical protein BP01DRAFT_419863 [Aspergillus saccharolyticus JOP 1030-1]